MSSWLGIDHGAKRIGVAVGDTASKIATPLEVIPAAPQEQALRRIGELARQYRGEGIVVGLPVNMDGSEGPQAAAARQMAEQVAAALHLPVRLFDERLSSFAADQALAGHLTRGKKKARQDALAAATMLGDFLAAQGPPTAQETSEK
ncbi:MAG: Holliday junction resolvase RuvX [Phycisphaerae bacterium]|nr:Holliday junction resolvase RuvX [Phycisphaerae bacterium]